VSGESGTATESFRSNQNRGKSDLLTSSKIWVLDVTSQAFLAPGTHGTKLDQNLVELSWAQKIEDLTKSKNFSAELLLRLGKFIPGKKIGG